MKIHCPKCRGKQNITGSPDGVPPGIVKTKNKRYKLVAYCAVCFTKIGSFLGRSKEHMELIAAYDSAADSNPLDTAIPVYEARAKGSNREWSKKKEESSRKKTSSGVVVKRRNLSAKKSRPQKRPKRRML